MSAMLGGLLLGLLLGLRHALEPDHVAALSTLVVGARSRRESARLGAIWGLGHTVALVGVGGGLVLTGAVLPVRAGAVLELVVAGMLVLLGARAIARAVTRADDGEGDDAAHVAHAGRPRGTPLVRPLVVGLVHGVAGSGAVTALVIAQLPSAGLRLAYIAVFGVGSIAGMALASLTVGASLGARHHRPRQRVALCLATGVLSAGVGIHWAIAPLGVLGVGGR